MRALVAGWFSFEEGHATAGDLITRDEVCDWLGIAGIPYDVALVPPFSGGVDWRQVDPKSYSHVVFVCGPFGKDEYEQAFLSRFKNCRLIGMNLSMKVPLKKWNPFDLLIERDSSAHTHPDLAFGSRKPHVPVVGVCLVEPYDNAPVDKANSALLRLVQSNEVAAIPVDTRLDENSTGLKTPAEIESVLARMDVVLTTRLHGTVLSLKNGIPVIAIDPEVGGWKIRKQAQLLGWPVVFNVEDVTDDALQKALNYCLTAEARLQAAKCGDRAKMMVEDIKKEFIKALTADGSLEQTFQNRMTKISSELVSVIIPCYNHGHFLNQAIDSVLAQTYPRIEIIVVDDGSTDNTSEVAARYKNIQYVYQENTGLAAARNTGLRASHGSILVFLDADDRLLPEAVEQGVYALMDSPQSAFVSGRYRYTNEDNSIISEYSQAPADSDSYAAFLHGNYIGMHATVTYRRAAIEEAGGFNPQLSACEDYDLYLRIAKKHPVSVHGHLVAEYRLHGKNMSRNPKLMLKTVLGVLNSNWKYADEKPNYREAYYAGVAAWREYYSEGFSTLIYQQLSEKRIGSALHLALDWLRYAPRQFAGYVFWKAVGVAPQVAYRFMPGQIRRQLSNRRDNPYIPAKGQVQFGDFRRLTPFSREFGYDRGLPIDRYYIESFLARHAEDVKGRVLEVGDDGYTRRFGGERVSIRDVLHVTEGNPTATIVADLAHADHIPSNSFDCIILTQTLHLVYDVNAALHTLRRILKPGGILLTTFPGITQISIDEWSDCWYWAFTLHSAQRMFEEVFPSQNLEIQSFGNVLAATAFLQGLAVDELDRKELDHNDPHYQALITVRAVKPENGSV